MFFNKKKKSAAEATKTKSKEDALSKEELERLQNTKNRLFPKLSFKKPDTEPSTSVPQPKMQQQKPKLPPKPPVAKRTEIPPTNGHHDEDGPPNRAPPPLPPPLEQVDNVPEDNQRLTDSVVRPFAGASPLNADDGEPRSPTSPNSSLAAFDDSGMNLGFGSSFHPLKTFNLPGLKLPALEPTQSRRRDVTLKRLPTGDFGFSLRRAQIIEESSLEGGDRRMSSVPVLFAEPQSVGRGLPSCTQLERELMPGDLLLAVNGTPIRELPRDKVIELIRESGDSVCLTVRTVGELSELTIRSRLAELPEDDGDRAQRADLQLSDTAGRRDTRSSTDVSGNEGEGVWLMHRDGYAAAHRCIGEGDDDEEKVKIRLDANGVEMTVDTDDVEPMNPRRLDRVEDVARLVFVNECSTLHLLRQRFAANLVHTYAGPAALLVLNPRQPLATYSDKILEMFKGCKRETMPPHIYAFAQQIYRRTQMSGGSESVVFSGRSGSGKTTQVRHFMRYLAVAAASSNNNVVTAVKLQAMFTLLEAFGDCRTANNGNASRFATVLTVDFDHMTQLSAASLQCLLLERQRVARWSPEDGRDVTESNFHIFERFWRGLPDARRRQLQLQTIENSALLPARPSAVSADPQEASADWEKLVSAFGHLGVSDAEREVIEDVLAACFHLCHAEATRGTPSYKAQFIRASHAQKAATLLGVTQDELHRTIFASRQTEEHRLKSATGVKSWSLRQSVGGGGLGGRLSVTDRSGDGMEALQAFVVGLYQETFNLLVSFINRSFASNYRTVTSITVVDCPGLQLRKPKANGDGKTTSNGGNFYDFCFNYCNERLNQLYYDSAFTNQLNLYETEQVDVDFEPPTNRPHPLVEVVDKPSQQELINSTNIELRSTEKRGLLWLLDEESVFPGATDESFMERIFAHYAADKSGQCSLRRSRQYNHFVLRHSLGSLPISYNVNGWLKQAQYRPLTAAALPFLQQSNKEDLCRSFGSLRAGGLPGVPSVGVLEGGGGGASARRATTVLKSLAAAGGLHALKRNTYCAVTKVQMDYIIERARRTSKMYTVHCLLATTTAAETTLVEQRGGSTTMLVGGGGGGPTAVNVPLLRAQLRGGNLLDGVRLDKIGFPVRMAFAEFRRRFECVVEGDLGDGGDTTTVDGINLTALDDRRTAAQLMHRLEVDANDYRLGLSQVFMRSDLLSRLEDKRDGRLMGMVISVQAHCRAFLVRRKLERRKVEDVAIRCIQKNITKYMAVKSWQWWRLYTRVLPLLNVRRTELQMESQAGDLTELRDRCARLEAERSEWLRRTTKAEEALAHSRADLADERAALHAATDALANENAERVRLEKDCASLRQRTSASERKTDKLQVELMQLRTLDATLPIHDGEEEETTGEESKEKVLELRQQMETVRKQQKLQADEQTEHFELQKKQLHKRASSAERRETEERERAETERRRATKAQRELAELRLHTHTLSATAADADKRQRRFDQELRHAVEETTRERQMKERLLREKEETLGNVYRLQTQIRELKEKAEELEKERDEAKARTNSNFGVNDDSASLLRDKNSLQAKADDLEEELDELAGERDRLKAAVTRLEMHAEKMKQDTRRDAQSKETEIEALRQHNHNRIRLLEQQIEEETEQRTSLQREKREIEAKLRDVGDQRLQRDVAGEAQLRASLKATTALLEDAQTMLVHHRDQAPSRGMLKQLRNQLDDSEFGRLAAIKSKAALEGELAELRSTVEGATAARAAAEERTMALLKERNALQSRHDDVDDDYSELLKKYKAHVQQGSVDTITLSDQAERIGELEKECEKLKEQVTELSSQLTYQQSNTVEKHRLQLIEYKLRDAEAKLDIETAMRQRTEGLLTKSKEQIESLRSEVASLQALRDREAEMLRRAKGELTANQSELHSLQRRDADTSHKLHELESALERAEAEHQATVADLKLAIRRVDALQAALSDEACASGDGVDDDAEDGTNSTVTDEYDRASSVMTNGVERRRRSARDGGKRGSLGIGSSPIPRSLSSGERPGSAASSEVSGRVQKTSTPALR